MADDPSETKYVNVPGWYTLSVDALTAFPPQRDPLTFAVLGVVGELGELSAALTPKLTAGVEANHDPVEEVGDVLLSLIQMENAASGDGLYGGWDVPKAMLSRPGVELAREALVAAALLAEMVKKGKYAGTQGSVPERYMGRTFGDYYRDVFQRAVCMASSLGADRVVSAMRGKIERRRDMAGLRKPPVDPDDHGRRW